MLRHGVSIILFFLSSTGQRKPTLRNTVTTSLGKIEGETVQGLNAFKYNSFKGIPYAKAPIEELRFEKPVPIESWSETLKATTWAPRCYYVKTVQNDTMDKMMNPGITSEDCLYLNIFVPKRKSVNFPKGYPVLFWIHGGAFTTGSALEYGVPEMLISKEVIIVSINYRLSLLGFFATEDSTGNFGLWDQTMALRWVKDHIGNFAGDPSRITVFGESAGGISASLLSISPHSNGLFQNVITMSGALNSQWGARDGLEKAGLFAHSRAIAKKLECVGKSNQILQCLKKIAPEKLEQTNMEIIFSKLAAGTLDIGPIVDGEFFPQSVDVLLAKAPKKPIITGVTEVEGYRFALPLFPMPMVDTIQNLDTFDLADFAEKLDFLMMRQKFKRPDLIKRLLMHEFVNIKGNKSDSHFLARQWAEMLGDWMITRSVVKESLEYLKLGWPTWFYNFEYLNMETLDEHLRFEGMAAYHGTELSYVFSHPVLSKPFKFDKNDTKVAELTTTLWANFAKFSKPTPEPVGGVLWKETSKEHPLQYLKIKPELKMKEFYRKDMVTFWNDLVRDIEANCY